MSVLAKKKAQGRVFPVYSWLVIVKPLLLRCRRKNPLQVNIFKTYSKQSSREIRPSPMWLAFPFFPKIIFFFFLQIYQVVVTITDKSLTTQPSVGASEVFLIRRTVIHFINRGEYFECNVHFFIRLECI